MRFPTRATRRKRFEERLSVSKGPYTEQGNEQFDVPRLQAKRASFQHTFKSILLYAAMAAVMAMRENGMAGVENTPPHR